VTIQEITKIVKKGMIVPCTGCDYCEPCPAGVSIPQNFAMMNNMVASGTSVMDIMFRKQIRQDYNGLAQSKEEHELTGKAGCSLLCVECGECLPKCPQSINIPEELKSVNGVITKQKMTIREVFQLISFGVKNWRLVISRIRKRNSS